MSTPEHVTQGNDDRQHAEALREVLSRLGVAVGPCLPGESAACGADDQVHVTAWLVCLKARAQFGLETLGLDDLVVEHLEKVTYEWWLEQFRGGFFLTRPQGTGTTGTPSAEAPAPPAGHTAP